MFFDVDEYLIIPKYKNIHQFLNENKYYNYDIIHVSWVMSLFFMIIEHCQNALQDQDI